MSTPSQSSETNLETDLALVRRAISGENSAVRAVVKRLMCVPRILAHRARRHSLRLSASELEDLAQQTLLTIWRRLETYEGVGVFEAWVYRCCVLELMAFVRQRDRLPEFREDVSGIVGTYEGTRSFQHELLYRALDDLDPMEGNVLRLKHFEDRSFSEIASLLAVSKSTVKTWYYRALPKLRDSMRNLGVDSEERSA